MHSNFTSIGMIGTGPGATEQKFFEQRHSTAGAAVCGGAPAAISDAVPGRPLAYFAVAVLACSMASPCCRAAAARPALHDSHHALAHAHVRQTAGLWRFWAQNREEGDSGSDGERVAQDRAADSSSVRLLQGTRLAPLRLLLGTRLAS